ncbi:hypothetical protein Nepgr_026249 [Nepenthes gracilis]|uniref:Transmembrane protein n=1 Tax=Nepenthes gracilis TaxID=150966 RepID=A0AAD3Y2A2_NEPGR|nr:hypothetical protein Nepgr_026249 [Nepenthes gracilis]
MYPSLDKIVTLHPLKLSILYLRFGSKFQLPSSVGAQLVGMADWAPVLVGVVLFVLLSPGLLFQIPGYNRSVEFGGMKTNGKAIFVHTLIFFALYAILILAVHLHIYTG